MSNGKPWTLEEERMVTSDLYDLDELVDILGRSYEAILSKRDKLRPIDSNKDKSLRPIRTLLTTQEKEARIYAMAHRLGVKII